MRFTAETIEFVRNVAVTALIAFGLRFINKTNVEVQQQLWFIGDCCDKQRPNVSTLRSER